MVVRPRCKHLCAKQGSQFVRIHRHVAGSWRHRSGFAARTALQHLRVVAAHTIDDLRDLCRIPDKANTIIKVGTLDEVVQQVAQSDMDFFGMRHDLDLEFVARMVKLTRSSCAFTMDSGMVNALA